MKDLPPAHTARPGDFVACKATITRHGGDVSQARKWHVESVDGDEIKIRRPSNRWRWRRVKAKKWVVVHRPEAE